MMKTWIKQILRENLEEIRTKPKGEFGAGCFHCVYKSEKHPDRLYKVGKKNIVRQWINIFKKEPRIFPKVYRVFESKNDPDYWVVEIEKLNTEDARRDYDIANRYINAVYTNVDVPGEDTKFYRYPFVLRNMFELDDINVKLSDYIKVLDDYMRRVNASDLDRTLTIKWAITIYSVYNMLKNRFKFKGRDIHADNVAYDNNGNIKIIDI